MGQCQVEKQVVWPPPTASTIRGEGSDRTLGFRTLVISESTCDGCGGIELQVPIQIQDGQYMGRTGEDAKKLWVTTAKKLWVTTACWATHRELTCFGSGGVCSPRLVLCQPCFDRGWAALQKAVIASVTS